MTWFQTKILAKLITLSLLHGGRSGFLFFSAHNRVHQLPWGPKVQKLALRNSNGGRSKGQEFFIDWDRYAVMLVWTLLIWLSCSRMCCTSNHDWSSCYCHQPNSDLALWQQWHHRNETIGAWDDWCNNAAMRCFKSNWTIVIPWTATGLMRPLWGTAVFHIISYRVECYRWQWEKTGSTKCANFTPEN